jgi:hypothetical protein
LAQANRNLVGSIAILRVGWKGKPALYFDHHFIVCSGRVAPPALFLSGWLLAPPGKGSWRVDQLHQLPDTLKPATSAALSATAKRLAHTSRIRAGSMAILPSVGA